MIEIIEYIQISQVLDFSQSHLIKSDLALAQKRLISEC